MFPDPMEGNPLLQTLYLEGTSQHTQMTQGTAAAGHRFEST